VGGDDGDGDGRSYTLDANLVDAINQFFDLTYDHWTANGKKACTPKP
jgi:hypothetical protein